MFQYTPDSIPQNIFVIGAGGTGGRLIPLLSQFLRSITKEHNPRGWLTRPQIFLVDGDIVEQKNLLRQNFIQMDVNKPKAVVLADRYSRAYGIDIFPIVKMVGDGNLSTLLNDVPGFDVTADSIRRIVNNSIVVICVDSAEARRKIFQTFNQFNAAGTGKIFYIDAGNEDNFGQVRFFHDKFFKVGEAVKKHLKEDLTPCKMNPAIVPTSFIPMDVEFYENLKDTPAAASCADLDQTLAINAIMATAIMGVIQNYYFVKPFKYNAISMSLDGSYSVSHNTYQNWLSKVRGTSATSKLIPESRMQSSDITTTFHNYIQANTQMLKSLGLKPDGTPIKAPKPVVEEISKVSSEEITKEPPKQRKSRRIKVDDIAIEDLEASWENSSIPEVPTTSAAPNPGEASW